MPEQAYIYQADIWCEACGKAIRERLTVEGKAPAAPDNEGTYDSDDFPKGPYTDGGGEADSYQHCAGCGLFLANPLTRDGVQYVLDALRGYVEGCEKNVEVLDLWAEDLEDYCLDKHGDFVLEAYRVVRKLEAHIASLKGDSKEATE